MKQVINFLKGLCIGISNVIPGFCSGLMAIILKSYDEYLIIFGEIFVHPIKTIKNHFSIILGIIFGIILAIFGILSIMENYPVPAVLFFVGLIIGTIPDSLNNIKSSGNLKILDYIVIIISSLILIALTFLKPINSNVLLNFQTILIVFLLGIIASIAMIVPGVSGSLILMSLGYYVFLMSTIKETIQKILIFDYTNIFDDFSILFTFACGAIIGFIYITKIINTLFIKKPKLINSIIFGLIIASPFSVIYRVTLEYKEVLNLNNPLISIISSILLVIGIFISGILPKLFKNKL